MKNVASDVWTVRNTHRTYYVTLYESGNGVRRKCTEKMTTKETTESIQKKHSCPFFFKRRMRIYCTREPFSRTVFGWWMSEGQGGSRRPDLFTIICSINIHEEYTSIILLRTLRHAFSRNLEHSNIPPFKLESNNNHRSSEKNERPELQGF